MSIQRTAEYTNSLLQKPIIIGVTGTLSAGKDVLAEYLEKEHDFFHVSTGDILRAEKRKAFGNSPEAHLDRGDSFANEMRQKQGAGILVELAYNDFVLSDKKRLVVSGIRSIGELEKLKELDGRFIFVDADPKIRYERAQSRSRDHNDTKTLEEFLDQEASESDGVDENDKTVQNLPYMKEHADIVIENNSTLDKFLQSASDYIFEG